jgi:hypothetical protein
MRDRRRVLAVIAAGIAALFVAGFVKAWVDANGDRRADHRCRALQPARGRNYEVLQQKNGTRLCVWRDARGRIVLQKSLP